MIIRFADNADLSPRSREVFHLFKPENPAEWLTQAAQAQAQALPQALPTAANLRGRVAHHMPELALSSLRGCQVGAVTRLDRSLAQNKPRAFVNMAAVAGKTFTAITSVYRLLKFGGAKRV